MLTPDPGTGAREPIRVLMLLHHFPPSAVIAAQRARRLVRRLPELGVTPLIVSGSAAGGADGRNSGAPGEGARRGRGGPVTEWVDGVALAVLRVRGPDPIGWYHHVSRRSGPGEASAFRPGGRLKRWLRATMVPDEHVLRIRAMQRGGARMAASGCDLIYSTSSPYSAHLAGRALAAKLGLPWVMELRDQWAENRYLPQMRNPMARPLQRTLEARCLRSADRIIVLSDAHADSLKGSHPRLAPKIRVVPNMFEAQEGDLPARRPPGGPLRILFSGSIYGGRALAEVGRAVDEVSPGLAGFEGAVLEVAGRSFEGTWDEVLGGSGPRRRVHGLLSPSQVGELMKAAHAGIVNNPAWDRIHIPGKLYEYLGAGLPVLNFSRQSDIPRLCNGLVPCWQLDSEDRGAILNALRELAQWWRDHPSGPRRPSVEHPLSSVQVAARLVQVFREVL